MASGANDRGASGFLHKGFLEGFNPSEAELSLICEDRFKEYGDALKQEKTGIGGRQIAAAGAVFAQHIGCEGDATVIAVAASMYKNAYKAAFESVVK